MSKLKFDMHKVDKSWHSCILHALEKVDSDYITNLSKSSEWLPGHRYIFNAFSLPLNKVNYVLLGESPYPRAASANGYAFWDAAVGNIWSATGLSKQVNRATSLRNIIKMLLVAEGLLTPRHTSQTDIALIDKNTLVQTNQELFNRFLQEGFLLLNASLVLQATPVQKDAKAWRPYLEAILKFLLEKRPDTQLILLGSIANAIKPILKDTSAKTLLAEHPYNHSFINNSDMLDFFKPLRLLKA